MRGGKVPCRGHLQLDKSPGVRGRFDLTVQVTRLEPS